jgi:nitroreductase
MHGAVKNEGDTKVADFSELLQTRRSIREFQEKDVPIELVKEMIKESCLAPSSGNGQPWEFILINNKDLIKRISDESKGNLLSYIQENPSSPMKKYEAALRNEAFNVFYNAPCLVLVVGPKAVRSLSVDCALLASYLMFSAASRGLGTCWVDLGSNIRSPEMFQEIGLPESHRIVAPIIVGHPKAIPVPSARQDPKILKIVS